MKESYITPQLKLLCLAPGEPLAGDVDFDDLKGGPSSGVSADPNLDIDIIIP